MRIASIDQGTTSTRAIMVGDDGQIEVVHAIPHQQHYPKDGCVEHDPEEIVANILTCIEACISAHGPLDAIGIDNQGESCLAWDAETREALSPILVWQDNRTAAELDTLRKDGAESETLARAGLPLDPYFSASKLSWILTHNPKAKAAHQRGTLRLGTTDAFFLHRLTGRCVTDATTASRTSLMNLETLTWDETLCSLFGVPMECLPEIVPTTGDFGAIKTEQGSVPVTASIVDQQAALYGFGCRDKGQAKITFGTGAFALMVTGDTIINRPDLGLLPTVAWQMQGQRPTYALDGGVFSASAAVNWGRSLGLFKSYNEINSFEASPAIERGLAFVPALTGLGCPHWQTDARGCWLGLSIEHHPTDLMQALLEGVALRAAEVIEAMNECLPISGDLLIDGGMSGNTYFTQFLANATGRGIRRARIPELTGLGTLSLAAEQTGESISAKIDFEHKSCKQQNMAHLLKFRQAITIAQKWSNGEVCAL
ncbi:FGGY family carbohydrate kinase [uncultured Cohaesibacter sp.]|uniref:FGGY family carbohydrate kinase n=1 Tax=uncultured Cohaesibacter sp. TaxID=1002546 RepID=UPI0029C604E8|nr:FGGY family carbohydrate kinase [uncultured Cohaesibacter sp.]